MCRYSTQTPCDGVDGRHPPTLLPPSCTHVAIHVCLLIPQAPDGYTLAMKLSVLTVEDQRGVHHEVTGGEGHELLECSLMTGRWSPWCTTAGRRIVSVRASATRAHALHSSGTVQA